MNDDHDDDHDDDHGEFCGKDPTVQTFVLTGILIVQGGPPHHFLVAERTHQEQVLIYDNLQGHKWIPVNQIKPKSLAWGFLFRRHDCQPYSFQPEQYKVIAPSTLNEADQSKTSKLSKPVKKVPIGVNASKYSNIPKPKKTPLGPSRVPSPVDNAPPPHLASPQAAQENTNQPDATVIQVRTTDRTPMLNQRGCPTTGSLAAEKQYPDVCTGHGGAHERSLPDSIIHPNVGTEASKPVHELADDAIFDKRLPAQPDCTNATTAKSDTCPREKDASPPKRTKFSEAHPYAIISLFDGVGSAMPAVIKAIGFAPLIVIAAECDPILRQIEGEQFHFRTDGKWSKTIQHTSAIYVDDIRKLLSDRCRVLREAFDLAGPQCRWIVIAGSPCQDLTLAGPFGGLLGLTGPCSSLFYYVHVILWFLQMNYPIELIRFLLENAGTMLDIHRKAILRAHGLNVEINPDHLRFDPKHTHGIKRNRFFFRNYQDCSSVAKNAVLASADESGPLIDCGGYPIPFGPLLRVRAVIGHNVYPLSWASHQPISLIWDYRFWGGRDEFQAKVKMQSSDSMPQLDFTHALSPGQAINRKLKPVNRKLKPVNRKLKPVNRKLKPVNRKLK